MRKLLTTSALVVPLLAMPGYAQDTQTPPEAMQTQDQMPAGTDGADVEVIPAEEADVEVVQEGEEPDVTVEDPATDDPAMTDPAMTGPTTDDPAMGFDEPTGGETMQEGEATAPPASGVVMEQGADELRADWVMGTSVISPQGEAIGQIQDVIITPDGQITSAILSVGGFLGLGAKNIAVEWSELQIGQDAQEITLNLTREEAEQAPDYSFRDQAQPPEPAGAMAPEGGDPLGTAPAGDPGMAPAGDPGAPAGGGTME